MPISPDKQQRRMHPYRLPTVIVACLLSVAAFVQPAASQQAPDPLRFVLWPVQDLTGLASGISPRDVLWAAGAGLVVFGASRFDRPVSRRLAPITDAGAIRVVEEFGNPRVVLPVTVLVFTGALLSGDARFQDAAFTSVEAILFADALTGLLKVAVGRARPHSSGDPRSLRPFSGQVSFPSGHATTAFAALTPWFLYYPGPVTAGLLVLAGATAFSRMATNEHWLSDVMAGSAIGFTTAYALSRRHVRIGAARIEPGLSANAVSVAVRF